MISRVVYQCAFVSPNLGGDGLVLIGPVVIHPANRIQGSVTSVLLPPDPVEEVDVVTQVLRSQECFGPTEYLAVREGPDPKLRLTS